ncbi:LOW QUALITY PROTEIN: protein PAT1 homolog 2 [Alosa alosa]|nr:LOW QUALITY PROTEIN: protein PAT1 homolog 2 [Alosa alosa]
MSDTEQPETEAPVPDAAWPESGGQWSDGESDAMEDSGLLQEMVEEDESIDLYNEETFGADAELEGGDILGRSIDDGAPVPAETPPPQPSSSSPPPPPPSPSPAPLVRPPYTQPPVPRLQPRLQPRVQPRSPAGVLWGRCQRGGRGQMFEDPAVLKSIRLRPSLKSLDSAIVDCSRTSYWEQENSHSWVPPNQGFRGPLPKPILQQDEAILRVIDRPAYGPRMPTYPNFLSKSRPYMPTSFRGRRGLVRECPPVRPLPQGWYSQMHPMVPRSPLRPRQLLNPGSSLTSPASHPQPMTPKMAQPRFGPLSPRPAPFYSPSANALQRFRFPGSVIQLHPQHKRLLSQRPPKPHSSTYRKPERWDPYAELMSDKEKEWIIRLQMIQLQSENPHLDDYYYQEYYKRMEAKLAEEEKRGDWAKRETPKLTTPYVTKTEYYTPVVHIEGSLGQVAVSTCFSPRRAIDTIRGHSPDEDGRHPRLEVHIEKLFSALLEVEEAARRKVYVSVEEKQQLLQDMQRKVEQVYSQIRHTNPQESNEEFLPCLLVSKGKRLLARLLPFLSHDAALHVLTMVTTHLPMLISKDLDEALPVLYAPLRDVVSALSFSQLVGVLKEFTVTVPETNETILTLACQNEFGLSLLYALLSQGERLLSSNVPMEPNIGDFETWTDTVFQVAQQLSKASLVEPLFLPSNLLTLFCRYLDKRTVHQLKSNIESASGYLAVVS